MTIVPFSLDVFTVIKAAQQLSAEIDQDRLVEKMLALMVEYSGARRGVFILLHLDELFIEAERLPDVEEVMVQRIGPVTEGSNVPVGLISSVRRSREILVLSDASLDAVYGQENYFQNHYTRSVMCLPLLRQGQLQGMLYLENDLAAGIFTDEKKTLSKLLASQAVISLQNAGLFNDLMEMNALLGAEVSRSESLTKTLQKSEEQYRLLAENVADVIWTMDFDMCFTYCSPSVERILGYTVEEVMGKVLADIMPVTFLDLVMKMHRKEMALARKNVSHSERLNSVDVQLWCKDGSLIWAETRTILLRDADGTAYGILGVSRNISDRKRTEADLMESYERMRNLSRYLQDVREQERTLISRDIHDELGQSLAALKTQASQVDTLLPQDLPEVHLKLQEVNELLSDTEGTIQRIESDLRPKLLDHLGLIAAIKWQAVQFTRQYAIGCELDIDPCWQDPDPKMSTAFFRILQEALTNVARHSEATEVHVALSRNKASRFLTVKDNGKGIVEQERRKPTAFGLMGMHERCIALGGTCDIVGASGRGTSVEVVLPDKTVTGQ